MTNPLVKKGIPTFDQHKRGSYEQLEHEAVKDIPVTGTIKDTNTKADTRSVMDQVTSSSDDLSKFYSPEVKIEKKQVSIYLDTDVIESFNEFGREHGKGAKSDLVNNFLKQMFKIRPEQ